MRVRTLILVTACAAAATMTAAASRATASAEAVVFGQPASRGWPPAPSKDAPPRGGLAGGFVYSLGAPPPPAGRSALSFAAVRGAAAPETAGAAFVRWVAEISPELAAQGGAAALLFGLGRGWQRRRRRRGVKRARW